MTNEEKAREIKANDVCCVWNGGCPNVYNAAMKMAEWKDKQHGVVYVVTRCEEHSDYVEEVFFDIEKAEQYCAKYNSNDDDYRRHITKVNITL